MQRKDTLVKVQIYRPHQTDEHSFINIVQRLYKAASALSSILGTSVSFHKVLKSKQPTCLADDAVDLGTTDVLYDCTGIYISAGVNEGTGQKNV